jgi:inorganic pyrophosphatase
VNNNKCPGPRESQQGDHLVRIIVETPRVCRNKYRYDEHTGWLKLSKVEPEGIILSYDFGSIPDTEAEDGDPLDVLVLTDEPTFPGRQVERCILGVIKAEQEQAGKKHHTDRLIAVAQQSVLYNGITEPSGLNSLLLRQIEAFFINYQKVRDIECTILAHEGSQVLLRW